MSAGTEVGQQGARRVEEGVGAASGGRGDDLVAGHDAQAALGLGEEVQQPHGVDVRLLGGGQHDLAILLVDGGDAAFDIDVFPRVATRLIWYAADDEFPPSATLLLPDNIESFLNIEDVVVMSESLVSRLSGRDY